MAKLTTPIIPRITTFDPTVDITVDFLYTGNQINRNRAVVIDTSTYQTVYDNEQYRMRLDHVFPNGTFTPGKSYQIKIKVFDSYGNESDFSAPTLFYCYSTPSFGFSNLTSGEIVRTANLTLNLFYSQAENDTLKEYQIQLYDYNKILLTTSGNLYDASNMTCSFNQLKNEHEYYVKAVGITKHDMSFDTGLIPFTVKYITIPTNVLFQVKNQSIDGRISLESGVIDIEYRTTNDNYTIKNGELTIGVDNVLTYYNGFKIDDEFQVFLKARKLPLNTAVFKMTCPDTGEFLWLEVRNYYGKYYGVLTIPYGNGMGYYNVFSEIPNPYLTDADGNLITDTDDNVLMMSSNDYMDHLTCVYDIEYKKGWYDLKTYFETDKLVEDV